MEQCNLVIIIACYWATLLVCGNLYVDYIPTILLFTLLQYAVIPLLVVPTNILVLIRDYIYIGWKSYLWNSISTAFCIAFIGWKGNPIHVPKVLQFPVLFIYILGSLFCIMCDSKHMICLLISMMWL